MGTMTILAEMILIMGILVRASVGGWAMLGGRESMEINAGLGPRQSSTENTGNAGAAAQHKKTPQLMWKDVDSVNGHGNPTTWKVLE
ncbi:hypothetical protein EAE96_011366 [Botrytis aclada]|nr:hypothetical protein EAE96_011366 [Botrytis aclada]